MNNLCHKHVSLTNTSQTVRRQKTTGMTDARRYTLWTWRLTGAHPHTVMRSAKGTCAAGPADPVNVCVYVPSDVVVDDGTDVGDIETTCWRQHNNNWQRSRHTKTHPNRSQINRQTPNTYQYVMSTAPPIPP